MKSIRLTIFRMKRPHHHLQKSSCICHSSCFTHVPLKKLGKSDLRRCFVNDQPQHSTPVEASSRTSGAAKVIWKSPINYSYIASIGLVYLLWYIYLHEIPIKIYQKPREIYYIIHGWYGIGSFFPTIRRVVIHTVLLWVTQLRGLHRIFFLGKHVKRWNKNSVTPELAEMDSWYEESLRSFFKWGNEYMLNTRHSHIQINII